GLSVKTASRTSRTVRPEASASGSATWRWMLGVKTTLAIDCVPLIALLDRAPLGGRPERVPTGWNFPARHARACRGRPRLFLALPAPMKAGGRKGGHGARACGQFTKTVVANTRVIRP